MNKLNRKYRTQTVKLICIMLCIACSFGSTLSGISDLFASTTDSVRLVNMTYLCLFFSICIYPLIHDVHQIVLNKTRLCSKMINNLLIICLVNSYCAIVLCLTCAQYTAVLLYVELVILYGIYVPRKLINCII